MSSVVSGRSREVSGTKLGFTARAVPPCPGRQLQPSLSPPALSARIYPEFFLRITLRGQRHNIRAAGNFTTGDFALLPSLCFMKKGVLCFKNTPLALSFPCSAREGSEGGGTHPRPSPLPPSWEKNGIPLLTRLQTAPQRQLPGTARKWKVLGVQRPRDTRGLHKNGKFEERKGSETPRNGVWLLFQAASRPGRPEPSVRCPQHRGGAKLPRNSNRVAFALFLYQPGNCAAFPAAEAAPFPRTAEKPRPLSRIVQQAVAGSQR